MKFKLPFYYGWIVVVALCLATASYGLFASLGVLFRTFQNEFAWSATLVSSAGTLQLLTVAFGSYFAGRLIDLKGPRFTLLLSALMLGTGFVLISRITEQWQFFACWFIASLGMAHGMVLGPSVVQKWFKKNTGLALGIVVAGSGLGTLVVPGLVDHIEAATNWRTTFFILGVSGWAYISICALLLKPSPLEAEPEELRHNNETAADPGGNRMVATTKPFRNLVLSRDFITITLVRTLASIPIFTVFVHIVPYAEDAGLTRTQAALTLSIIGAGNIVGRVMGGLVLDRMGWKRGLVSFLSLASISILVLMVARNPFTFYLFAILFGLAYSAEIPAVIGWTGTLFGTVGLATLLGIQGSFSSFTGAFGPLIGGLSYDQFNSYHPALAFCFLAFVTSVLMALRIKEAYKYSSPGEKQ